MGKKIKRSYHDTPSSHIDMMSFFVLSAGKIGFHTRAIESSHDIGRDHGHRLAILLEALPHALHEVVLDILEKLGRDSEFVDERLDSILLLVGGVLDLRWVDLDARGLGDDLAGDGG